MARSLFAAVSLAGVVGGVTLLAPPPGDRMVKVFGDLATADHVAVIVPGSDVTAATFDGGRRKAYSTPGGAARAVAAEARAIDPAARTAVIAWLGYDSPRTPSLAVATDGAAAKGAEALRRAIADLRRRTSAPVTLLCHSYGSVVCAKALPGLPVDDVAVVGSPGLGVAHASALRTSARLWAGRGAADWMRFVPSWRIGSLGFGADPVNPSFGARVFAAGAGGHSDYFQPGSVSLRNLTLIALGRAADVAPAR
ncbi:alpha/beta hydrolase family protein [Sphaerisporangium corydalis]|uniref:Alpha/beta hydrolase family protein n=1 Tax=Sphaerisporangium corydalis TaxID=1441875 RepID=A0ABV9E8N3_9ACTN|nr:alpha/beta hydrolase family protein [Sphaerisporangium corydalis]